MSDLSPHIRHRVQLPDGKHVEIVYRDYRCASSVPPEPARGSAPADQPEPHSPYPSSAPSAPPAASEGADRAEGPRAAEAAPAGAPLAASTPASAPACEPAALHVCFNCAGEFVYPLDWAEEGDRHWRIVLRCPECEAHREGVFEQSVVERLDDELDRATGELLGDLRQITHANMTDEIDFFVRALDADLITPADF
ncbi:MAG TPA: hypothetical protein VL972_08725 [Solirubrobacteraceae bacterium]|nr:hypothetical protein [Solirubrobacteraceae bacterium]